MKKLLLFPLLFTAIIATANKNVEPNFESEAKVLSQNEHFIKLYNDVFNLNYTIYKAGKTKLFEKYVNKRATKEEINELLVACNFESEAYLKAYFSSIEKNKRIVLQENVFLKDNASNSTIVKEAFLIAVKKQKINILKKMNPDCAYSLTLGLASCAWTLNECNDRGGDPTFCNEAWVLCLTFTYLIYEDCFYNP